MISIEELSNKLNLLYHNCRVLSDKSCICLEPSGIYKLYTISENGYRVTGVYKEFTLLNNGYCEYCYDKGTLYGICDTMGNVITDPVYIEIEASKNNLVVVKEIGIDFGLFNIDTKRNVLECKYSDIRLYEEVDYIVTKMDFFDIWEVYNMDGTKAIEGRFINIIATNELLLVSLDGHYNEDGAITLLYNNELKPISCHQDKVKVNFTEYGVDITLITDGTEKTWRNLNILNQIYKKAGLTIW